MLARLKVIRSIVFGEPNAQAKTHIAKNNGVLALNVRRNQPSRLIMTRCGALD